MSEADKIEAWWKRVIENRRDGDSPPIYTVQDLSSPCQVEVFWVKEPLEGQLIVITSDQDRPDKEVIVNGPYSGENFVEKVREISEEDRWQRDVPPQRFKSPPGKKPKRSDVLASQVSTLTERLKAAVFSDLPESEFVERLRVWAGASSHILIGNIMDIEFPVEGDLKADEEGEPEQKSASQEDSDPDEELRPFGGGYIYPAVWVDGPPKKSFSEKVWGRGFRENEIVYTDELQGKEVVAFRDGLLLLSIDEADENSQESDADTIVEILNTLFGVGIIGRRFQWRSLYPREFVSGKMSADGIKNRFAEISTPSGRNQLLSVDSRPPDHRRGLMTSEELEYMIEVTEEIYPVSELYELITLHLRAHTHFLDDEYTASFILNWTVAEQFIEIIAERELEDFDGSNTNISQILKLAKDADIIDETIYSELTRHRRKRNEVVHEIDTVPVERAEDLDHLISELLRREINYYLDQTDVDPLEHRPDPMKPATRQGEYNPVKWDSKGQ